jgi:hypothetical protein
MGLGTSGPLPGEILQTILITKDRPLGLPWFCQSQRLKVYLAGALTGWTARPGVMSLTGFPSGGRFRR